MMDRVLLGTESGGRMGQDSDTSTMAVSTFSVLNQVMVTVVTTALLPFSSPSVGGRRRPSGVVWGCETFSSESKRWSWRAS